MCLKTIVSIGPLILLDAGFEIREAEFVHNEFWLNQKDLVRTMNDLVEDYTDDDSDPDGLTIPMISFLRLDSLYYCIVMCLVILVQFCKCIFLQI